jgi:hypothetical protein
MKNRALNPAYAFALCYGAMVCLAIAVNLMPIFLTTSGLASVEGPG